MAASLEEISADLEAGETREALIPRMPLFNVRQNNRVRF